MAIYWDPGKGGNSGIQGEKGHISGLLFLPFGPIPATSTFTSGPALGPPSSSGIAQAAVLARGGGVTGGAPPVNLSGGWRAGGLVTQKAAGYTSSIAQAGEEWAPGGAHLARKCLSPAPGTWVWGGSLGLVVNPWQI